MKKIFVLAIFLLVLPLSVFASPFGLKMGMSLDEIKEVCDTLSPIHLKDDIYIINPKNNHPSFIIYLAYIDDTQGLYDIRTTTYPIKTNSYGEDIKYAFFSIKDSLSKQYGEPKVTDEIRSDSKYKSDNEWLESIKDGSRTLNAEWSNSDTTPLPDNIQTITISIGFTEDNKVVILLEYQFTNYATIKEKQDEVF